MPDQRGQLLRGALGFAGLCPRTTAPRPAASWEGDSSKRLRVHQRPAIFPEVRHNVAVAPLAVAALRRRPLMDSATIPFPAVEDHVVLALADKFHVVIGAGFRP